MGAQQYRPFNKKNFRMTPKHFAFLLIIFACLIFSSSCKTAKTAQSEKLKPKSAKFLMKRLVKNQVNADWLSARAKVTYRDDYGVRKFSANIRMRKDSVIWMNFKKLSVEAARLQITPDSISVINRLDNEYFIESFELAQKNYGLPTSFEGLQMMAIGNPIFFTKDHKSQIDKGRYYLSGKTDRYETGYWLRAAGFLLSELEIEDFRNNRSVNVQFKDYQQMPDGQNFSYFRHLNLSSRTYGDMSIKIDLSKVEINVPKSIRFEIPERYKRVRP